MRQSAVLVLAALLFIIPTAYAQEVEIINIRVGQGDATLIRGPVDTNGDRVEVLFDAGDIPSRPGGRIVGAVLGKRGIDEVDFLIVSHYDADHIGGIVSGSIHGRSFLLGPNGEPGAVGDDDNDGNDGWMDNVFTLPDPDELGQDDDVRVLTFVDRGETSHPSSQAYAKYLGMANAAPNRVSIVDQSGVDNFEIDLGGGARLRCLAANGFVRNRTARVANVNTENERSLAFLLSFGGFDFLIAGDLIGRSFGSENARVENAVAEFLTNNNVEVDVLHVNHHGGNNASESDFLEAIDPEIAIVSAGNGNAHGHPHNDVLDRLVEAGVYRVIQTSWGATENDIPEDVRAIQAIYQNDIVIRTDGTTYEISTTRTFDVDE